MRGMACVLGLTGLLTLTLANAEEPRFHVILKGAQPFKNDLRTLVQLSPTQTLRDQWKTLNETLEAFLEGVNENEPMRLDAVLTADGPVYAFYVPVTRMMGKTGAFQHNLEGFGYKMLPSSAAPNLFDLQIGKKSEAWMLNMGSHALVANRKQDAVPGEVLPTAWVAPVRAGADVAVSYGVRAENMESSRKTFGALRKQIESTLKFKREEPSYTELRKLINTQVLNELERFVAESQQLDAQWSTDENTRTGSGSLRLVPLPNTTLAESVELVGATPSRFAGVKLGAVPVALGKVHLPLDSMRIAHFSELFPKLRAAFKTFYENRETLSPAGKESAAKASALLFDIVEASHREIHTIDAFFNLHAVQPGKNQLVMGVRAVKTDLATQLVELLPQAKNDWKIVLNQAEHAGVAIHSVTFPARRLPEFQAFLPGESELLVGIGPDVVWGAAGPGALDALKTAIDQSTQPGAPDPRWFYYSAKLGPSMAVWDLISQGSPGEAPKTKEEIRRKKEYDRVRKLAVECSKLGDDLIEGDLSRDGAAITGKINAQPGFLRYMGAFVADFVKENM